MDAGRYLSGAAALLLAGCATGEPAARPAQTPPPAASAAPSSAGQATMAPIPNPPERRARAGHSVVTADPPPVRPGALQAGRMAIAEANRRSREPSRADAFVGGLQIFDYAPGRVYEVWTAPFRVTTLTLGLGETITAKAAGDTVRWQIGEAASGAGAQQRAHVMVKPLEAGLETNLVLTTSQRVYLVQLRSGPPESFNAAVAWDLGVLAASEVGSAAAAPAAPDPLVRPEGPLGQGFEIKSRGRRPRWTPTAVMTDGVRTFIAFPPELRATEAPALFVIAADGGAEMVNYRQQGGLMVVDRVLDRAELRMGGRRASVVRIERVRGGGS